MEKLILWLCSNNLRLNIYPEGGHFTNDPRTIVLSFHRTDKNGKRHWFNRIVSYEDFHESRALEEDIMECICSEALREIEKGERWDG